MHAALLFGCLVPILLAAAVSGEGEGHGTPSGYSSWDSLADLPDCDQAAVDCLKDVHTEAGKCVKLSFGKDFQKKCGKKIRHASRMWWHSSARWHRVAGACINHTTAVSDEHPVSYQQIMTVLNEQINIDNEMERMAEESLQIIEEIPEPEDDPDDKKKGPYSPEAQKCWYNAKVQSAKCDAQIIKKCKPLAVCIGTGPEPADRSSSKWYNYIRALRDFNDLAAIRMQVQIRHRCGY